MPEQANEEIEIGAPRDTRELDAMLAVMCEAFEMPFGAARDVFYSDPYFDPQNKLVLRVGGRVVSCLTLTRTRCWIERGIAELAGIAGVATLAAERRKGYAGALLTHAVRLLQQRDVALAGLLPYDFDFYRRFGWEQVGHANRQIVAVNSLPQFPQRVHVRPLRDEDIPVLEERWNGASKWRTLYCLRDQKRWRALLGSGRQAVVYHAPGFDLTGYLLYSIRPGSTTAIYPPQQTLPALCVQEFFGVDYIGMNEPSRGLLGWLATQTQVATIEFQQHVSSLALDNDFGFALWGRRNSDVVMKFEKTPAAMIRVISLRRILQVIADDWKLKLERGGQAEGEYNQSRDWRGTLLCVMRDPLKPGGSEQVVITGGEDDLLHVRAAWDGETCVETLSGDVGVWSQVVTGHISGSDACALGQLAASSPLAAKWADRLFEQQWPFLPVPDYF